MEVGALPPLVILFFVVTLVFLYLIARPLFSIHAIHKKAQPRRNLILFLSFLGGDDERQKALAQNSGIYDWLLTRLSFDSLAGDLDVMAAIKQEDEELKKTRRLWPWEMSLRAIHWHWRGGALKSVSIVCSTRSMDQVWWFLEICRKYREIENLDFYVVDKQHGRPL